MHRLLTSVRILFLIVFMLPIAFYVDASTASDDAPRQATTGPSDPGLADPWPSGSELPEEQLITRIHEMEQTSDHVAAALSDLSTAQHRIHTFHEALSDFGVRKQKLWVDWKQTEAGCQRVNMLRSAISDWHHMADTGMPELKRASEALGQRAADICGAAARLSMEGKAVPAHARQVIADAAEMMIQVRRMSERLVSRQAALAAGRRAALSAVDHLDTLYRVRQDRMRNFSQLTAQWAGLQQDGARLLKQVPLHVREKEADIRAWLSLLSVMDADVNLRAEKRMPDVSASERARVGDRIQAASQRIERQKQETAARSQSILDAIERVREVLARLGAEMQFPEHPGCSEDHIRLLNAHPEAFPDPAVFAETAARHQTQAENCFRVIEIVGGRDVDTGAEAPIRAD